MTPLPRRPQLVPIRTFRWDLSEKSLMFFERIEELADPGTATVKFWEEGATIVSPPDRLVFSWYARVKGIEYASAIEVGRAFQVYEDFAFRAEVLLVEAVRALEFVCGNR